MITVYLFTISNAKILPGFTIRRREFQPAIPLVQKKILTCNQQVEICFIPFHLTFFLAVQGKIAFLSMA